MKFSKYLEVRKSASTLICVDIQPEYSKAMHFNVGDFCNYLNKSKFNEKVILFNGPDLGFPDQNELRFWYEEHGLDEDTRLTFYDKGYAFFRYCIDSGIDEDDIVLLVKFMKEHDINDSRQITDSSLWDSFEEKYNNKELRELLEFAGDNIFIPDVMDFLSGYKNITLTGGGKDECLKEIEIALKANDQPYVLETKFLY